MDGDGAGVAAAMGVGVVQVTAGTFRMGTGGGSCAGLACVGVREEGRRRWRRCRRRGLRWRPGPGVEGEGTTAAPEAAPARKYGGGGREIGIDCVGA